MTLPGLALAVLAASALYFYGFGHTDLLLLVVGGLSLALLVICLLSVSATAMMLWLWLRNRVERDLLELECHYGARTGFSTSNLWYVPFVSVSWTWECPQGEVKLIPSWGRLQEQVTPLRRGEGDCIVRRVEVGDIFGLAKVALPIWEGRKTRFIPSKGALENIHVVQGMAGGDALAHPEGSPTGDQMDMRRYGEGDPIRYVLWKVFAKSRTLVVRTAERAFSPAQQTVAFLVAAPGDQAAAGTTRVAISGGALGSDWLLGADGCEGTARTQMAAMDLIVRSAATAEINGGTGLSAFLHQAPHGVRRAMVFVPPRPGPWLDNVVKAAQVHGDKELEFLICTDGIERKQLLKPIYHALLRAPKPAIGRNPTGRAELASVVKALGRCSSKIMVVDRKTGTIFHQSHLHSLVKLG